MSTLYLLDTNVLAELQKGEAHADRDVWQFLLDNEWLIPSPVLAEVQDGISRLAGGRRRTKLQADFDQIIDEYAPCLVGFSPEDALTWGQQKHSPAVKRQPQSTWDSLLDAMTSRRGAVLATRNQGDFRNCQTHNPFG